MADEFATVLKSWSVEEAHLARIRLADEGIECHLADDQTVGMDWGLANAIRGVSVVVKEVDADRARELLGEGPSGDVFDFPESDIDKGDDLNAESESEGNNQQSSDTERDNGTLGSMRSIARPVICLMVLPGIIWLLLALAGILMNILSGMTGRGY